MVLVWRAVGSSRFEEVKWLRVESAWAFILSNLIRDLLISNRLVRTREIPKCLRHFELVLCIVESRAGPYRGMLLF